MYDSATIYFVVQYYFTLLARASTPHLYTCTHACNTFDSLTFNTHRNEIDCIDDAWMFWKCYKSTTISHIHNRCWGIFFALKLFTSNGQMNLKREISTSWPLHRSSFQSLIVLSHITLNNNKYTLSNHAADWFVRIMNIVDYKKSFQRITVNVEYVEMIYSNVHRNRLENDHNIMLFTEIRCTFVQNKCSCV